MRNFDDHLNLNAGTERNLRPAKGGAGMSAALAKDIQKELGGAIGDLVRFGEVGGAVDQHHQLDDLLHSV